MLTSNDVNAVKLSAGQLEPLVREETANCTQLGIQLELPYSRLEDLEKEASDNKPSMDCLEEMLQQWLQDIEEDRKWSEVYKALEQQGNRRLKAILEKEHSAATSGNTVVMKLFYIH